MSALEKATLQELRGDGTPVGDPVPVQFNPTTLKLQFSNHSSDGQTRANQNRQSIGASSTTLTAELVFDTADEGDTNRPRSVREKTALVEKFIVPQSGKEGESHPPKVRFHWGELVIDGVMEGVVSLEFDLFASNGTPLRAKVGITIQEQNPKFMAMVEGPGAKKKRALTQPGGFGIGGSVGIGGSIGFGGAIGVSAGLSGQAGLALGGESAAEFAARVGVDPSAWRGLTIAGENVLSLEAGAEVGFSAGLSVNAGVGVVAGFEAGATASIGTSVGLETKGGLSAAIGLGVGSEVAAGFALSAAGGVTAAVETVQIAKTQAAEQQARQAFSTPSPTGQSVITVGGSSIAPTRIPPSSRLGLPEQPRAPLKGKERLSTSRQGEAFIAPLSPRADSRATSYGLGVPLRPRVGLVVESRIDAVRAAPPLKAKTASGEPPVSSDPTDAPWIALPNQDKGRSLANKEQHLARPARPCGCSGTCHHRRRR